MTTFRMVAAALLALSLACSKGDEEPPADPAEKTVQEPVAPDPDPTASDDGDDGDDGDDAAAAIDDTAAAQADPDPDPAPGADPEPEPAAADPVAKDPAPAADPKSGPPRNLKVLAKRWSRKQVEDYMKNQVNRGLGVKCTFCHDTDDYADDSNEKKIVARKMIAMTRDMNRQHFGGKDVLTCYTCHKGNAEP
jgi:hypothetical protein